MCERERRVCVRVFWGFWCVEGNQVNMSGRVSLRPLLKKRKWNGEKARWGRAYSVKAHHCREMFGVRSLSHTLWPHSLLFTCTHQCRTVTYRCIKLTRDTHKQSSGSKTDVLNQRRSTLVLISFLSSYIFVLIASCIFTTHLFSVLPCLVKPRKTLLVLQR